MKLNVQLFFKSIFQLKQSNKALVFDKRMKIYCTSQSHYIYMSHSEVSLVEQDTIERVSIAYLKFMIKF